MLNLLVSKGNNIKHLMVAYLDSVEVCYHKFAETLNQYLKGSLNESLEDAAAWIDRLETAADTERHKIIKKLLEGALLPESRRNILEMIELTDEIANSAENIIRQIYLQNITFNENIKDNLAKINDKSKFQLEILIKLMESMLSGYDIQENYKQIKKIEQIESEIDDLEDDAIRMLYRSNISLAEKNQQREIITEIADIADIIEDISDVIEIIMALRKI